MVSLIIATCVAFSVAFLNETKTNGGAVVRMFLLALLLVPFFLFVSRAENYMLSLSEVAMFIISFTLTIFIFVSYAIKFAIRKRLNA